MNRDETLKLRKERLAAFRAATGGGDGGVVPPGMAAFLLAVSSTRIKTLMVSGRLQTVAQAGQRWILFSSLRAYAEAGQPVSDSDMSEVGTISKPKGVMN